MHGSFRRYVGHWYAYRSTVAVVLGLAVGLGMFWLYNSPNVFSLHPEDRLIPVGDAPAPGIVIVGIDNASLDRTTGLGHFPFKRDTYAAVLDNLAAAGAAAVVFDIQFSEPFAGDAQFSAAIKRDRVPVVLAYAEDGLQDGDHQISMTGLDQAPLRSLWCDDQAPQNAPCHRPIAQLASSVIAPDGDGLVRRMPMFVEPQCHRLPNPCNIPILNPIAFVAAQDALGAQNNPLTLAGSLAQFSGFGNPGLEVDANGRAIINYSGAPGNFVAHHQYLSFKDVRFNSFARDRVAGKVVLIGAYGAAGLHDEQIAPVVAAGNGKVLMAGIEIHANMLSTLLRPAAFLRAEPWPAVLVLLLLLGVLTGLVVARLSVGWGLITTGAFIVLYTVAGAVMFSAYRYVPDLIHPWLAIALTYTGVTAYRFLYEDRERRKVTSIFGQYLSEDLVQELAADRSSDVMLGGSRRPLTLLFADIRDFTKMSESMPAEDVLKVVEEYLTDLSNIVVKWDGTIDKYVGDEIVAIWNAPKERPDHALNAVRCAFEMLTHGPALREKLAAIGLPQVSFGIGINTGPAVVGMMGSRPSELWRGRVQYTALGDTVNTAARFCGAAGPFDCLVGEETYLACKDYVAVELVPGIQLRGKSAGTFRVYRLLAIREQPGAPWVPFPAGVTSGTYRAFAAQTVLGAGATDLLGSQPTPRLPLQTQEPGPPPT